MYIFIINKSAIFILGIIMVCEAPKPYKFMCNENLQNVTSEEELFNELILLIHDWNPDILAGYEVRTFLQNIFNEDLCFEKKLSN